MNRHHGRRHTKIITVTKSIGIRRCDWCAAVIPSPTGPGRPRRFCRRSHRQRHYEARRLATRQGLAADEVLLRRELFDQWRDTLYALESAIEDVERDLGDSPALREYTEAFGHLYAAALEMRRFRLEPKALGTD